MLQNSQSVVRLIFRQKTKQATIADRCVLKRALSVEVGLISYGPDFRDIVGRAAPYVDRILRGAKRADLPVQVPVKFEMALNVKTAKALGLTVPASLLLRADEVIE